MKDRPNHALGTILAMLGLAAAGLALAGQDRAQDPKMVQPPDSTFALQAASGGMAEVKLGELAQSRGANNAIVTFGKQMEAEHAKVNDQLKDLSSRNDITLPATMNHEDQAAYDRLAKLSGVDFDKAYAQAMVADHQNDLATFKKEAGSGQNPDLKNFATQTLPILESHLQAATALAKAVGGTDQ